MSQRDYQHLLQQPHQSNATPSPSGFEIASWIATVIAGLCAVASVLLTIVSIGGSNAANKLAADALAQSATHHSENARLQDRLSKLEIWLKRPHLIFLNALPSEDGRLVVTIQNDGERDAALFSVTAVEDMHGQGTQTGSIEAGGAGAGPTPIETLIETINVNLSDRYSFNFGPPRVVKPGTVVNIAIRPPQWQSSGVFVLHYAQGETLLIGRYPIATPARPADANPFGSAAPAPSPESDAAPAAADPFGAPPAPGSQEAQQGPPQAAPAPAPAYPGPAQ